MGVFSRAATTQCGGGHIFALPLLIGNRRAILNPAPPIGHLAVLAAAPSAQFIGTAIWGILGIL
ncbi:MAG: hypothetical protein ACTS6J_00685 [Burkholderiales bacterium]